MLYLEYKKNKFNWKNNARPTPQIYSASGIGKRGRSVAHEKRVQMTKETFKEDVPLHMAA